MLSFFRLNILESDRGKMKESERGNNIDSESREAEKIGPHFSACISVGFDATIEQKMKSRPRGALITPP